MSNVLPFRYEERDVRARDDAGDLIFVAADVAPILGYADTAAMTRYLDEDEKGLSLWQTLGGPQRLSHLTEAGLYAAMMRSTSSQAKPFRRWVTHEVIPTIRRTGSYGTTPVLPQTYAEALRELASTVEAKAAVEAERDALAPRAGAWDHLASTSTDYSVQQAATILARDPSITIGQRRLFAWMDAHNWTYRRDGHRAAYQRRIESGHLAHRLIHHIHPRTGEVVVDAPQVRVTVKGLTELHRVLGGSAPLSVQPMLEVVA